MLASVIHGAVLEADHEQPAAAVTTALDDPPVDPKAVSPGAIANEQASPACETVTRVFATVKVPERGEVDVLEATE